MIRLYRYLYDRRGTLINRLIAILRERDIDYLAFG